jgi:hypothetical protein
MQTTEQRRSEVDADAIFDWRFASLRRAGYSHADAWVLASTKDVDIRRAERLLENGCPAATALGILL